MVSPTTGAAMMGTALVQAAYLLRCRAWIREEVLPPCMDGFQRSLLFLGTMTGTDFNWSFVLEVLTMKPIIGAIITANNLIRHIVLFSCTT